MKQKELEKFKVNHIVVSPFSADEKRTIHAAVKTKGVRRTRFYHDAIVKVAKEICDDIADNS